MDHKTDAEIVAGVLKGDRQSYALLVDAYKVQIFNLAFRMTGSREDADDLTQEIFIRAYQKLYQFDRNKKFFTWLYTIGINLIRNDLKKKQREILNKSRQSSFIGSMGNQPESIDGEVNPENNDVQLEAAMKRLPVDVREAIILKFNHDLTFEEIASITGHSVSAVKMRIYRGLEKLKKAIENNP